MSNSEITSLGEPKTVDVVAIERELTALWRSASRAEGTYPVIRACAMNLLVYVKGGHETRRAIDWIGKLISRHPCRAIILSVDPASPRPGLTSWISTLCHLPSNRNQQVCCEQIVFEAGEDSLRHLPGAAFPLLLPDLPVFLWWNDVPNPQDEVLLRFGKVAQRLIVDSLPFSNPRTQFGCLLSLSQKTGWRAALVDINWVRLRLWRSLLAQFFDCPNYRKHLQSVNRMTIEYHGRNRKTSTLPAQPLLLAGWFTSRLGWTPAPERHSVEGLCHDLFLRKGTDEFNLQIRMEMEGSQEHGEITAVRLQVSDESEVSYSLTRRQTLVHGSPSGSIEVEARMSGQDLLQRSVSLSGGDEATLLGELLDMPGRDAVFEQALDAAIAISSW